MDKHTDRCTLCIVHINMSLYRFFVLWMPWNRLLVLAMCVCVVILHYLPSPLPILWIDFQTFWQKVFILHKPGDWTPCVLVFSRTQFIYYHLFLYIYLYVYIHIYIIWKISTTTANKQNRIHFSIDFGLILAILHHF